MIEQKSCRRRGQSARWQGLMAAILAALCMGHVSGGVRDLPAMAENASKGVGVARKVTQGSRGAPIVLLEENHASRAGQIQHAVTLVRLYKYHGMRHIALEGYLKERKPIGADWFHAAAGGDSAARTSVAVRLLQEGEISSAEFMKLTYRDVSFTRSKQRVSTPLSWANMRARRRSCTCSSWLRDPSRRATFPLYSACKGRSKR